MGEKTEKAPTWLFTDWRSRQDEILHFLTKSHQIPRWHGPVATSGPPGGHVGFLKEGTASLRLAESEG